MQPAHTKKVVAAVIVKSDKVLIGTACQENGDRAILKL